MLESLREVAEEVQATPAQVALSWVMGRPGVTSTILGASRVSLVVPQAATVRLGTAGAPVPGFLASLGTPAIRLSGV